MNWGLIIALGFCTLVWIVIGEVVLGSLGIT